MAEPAPPGSNRVAFLASFALMATACTGVDEGRSESEVEQLRLGRVHVLLEGVNAEEEASDDLEVSARFAYVRGLEEEFVRARIDMPVLAQDVLSPQECDATERLTAAPSEADGGDIQELVLVDAGDLRLNIGDARYEVPLSLVPDLLPYMSGVEYVMYSDELPAVRDGVQMSVEASGSQTDELPPFVAEGQVPTALDLALPPNAYGEMVRNGLVFGWHGSDNADDTITVQITGLVGEEPAGSEITCVLNDTGQVRLKLDWLRALGLATNADAIQIEASRLTTRSFDVGDFAGSELVVERRETVVVR